MRRSSTRCTLTSSPKCAQARPGALSGELSLDRLFVEGLPLLLPVDRLEEDPANPRTEFPDAEIAELAQDIALRGILQPIVVLRARDANTRYRVLFGAKRLRAAKRAGLESVPVVIGSEAHDDVYAQVAENQKRHGLTPLDLAKFMGGRVDAGDSNAEIAKRLGIDLTSVAHHRALLTLPPELEQAFRSGRCTSPRTLYELAKLHQTTPERVKAIVTREGDITRSAVASLKKPPRSPRRAEHEAPVSRRQPSLVGRASDLCARLESLLDRMTKPGSPVTSDELAALRRRLVQLGSDSRRRTDRLSGFIGGHRPRRTKSACLFTTSPCQPLRASISPWTYAACALRWARARLATA